MNKKIELLAPAGNYDAFLAAVENGADAVYLGGRMLNARQFAGNFEDDELERALDYAHVRGVKILLTLNTLVLDEEMQQAVEYAAKVFEMGADAFIVQDIGLAAALKKAIPGISLHASTQMTTYSVEGVKALERMDFDRVVLARELQLEEIKNICSLTPLEIEVFVHGALCICYSGQCLMSSLIGGRSGNRGKCAQPCRLPYTITQDGKNIKSSYLLSPKDICYINNLTELAAAGVSSLKIEGRMKSPEYVATVVGTYRKYLDEIEGTSDQVSEEDMHRLLQSFNRGGFSTGYLKGKIGPEMMSYDKPKNWGTYLGTVLAQDKSTNSVKLRLENTLGNGDGIEIWSGKTYEESPGGIITQIIKEGMQIKRAQKGDVVWVSVIKGNVEKGSRVYKTSDKEMLEQAAATYAKGSRKAGVSARFTLRTGQLPVLSLQHFSGSSITVTGEMLPEKAVNKPLTVERISEQLKKMGSTPFNIVDLEIDMDIDVLIPISELNNIRRKASEQLEAKVIFSRKRQIGNLSNCYDCSSGDSGKGWQTGEKAKLSAMFYSFDKSIELSRVNADRLYLPFSDILSPDMKDKLAATRNQGKEVFAYIPAIIRGKQSQYIEKNIHTAMQLTDGFLAGSMGVVEILRKNLGNGAKIIGDYPLNVLNSSSLHFMKDSGYSGAALSYELNLSQLEAMDKPAEFETEVGVYGRIPVMTSEYCPVGGSVGNAAPHKCKTVCKNGIYHLKDRRNAAFPVLCDCMDCRSIIFNSNVLFAPELFGQIGKTGIRYLRLNFIDESLQEIYDIIDLHRALAENKRVAGQDKIIEAIKAKGFTKGYLSNKARF